MFRTLLAYLALLLPALVSATPLYDVHFRSDADDWGVIFTSALAYGEDGVFGDIGVGASDIYPERCSDPHDTNTCETVSLWITWEAGPLLGFEPYDYGYGKLTYGPGTLRVDATWGFGEVEPGIVIVAIESLIIDLFSEDDTDDDGFADEYGGDVIAQLGRGTLQPSLAAVLGVGTRILSGEYVLHTDMVDIDLHPAFFGIGGDNYGDGLSLLVTIPEPSALFLLAAGLFARRRSSARS